MKTKILILFVLLPAIIFSQHPEFNYAERFIGDDLVVITKMADLNNGDYVMHGSFNGNVNLGDTSLQWQNDYYGQFYACFSKDHELNWFQKLHRLASYHNFVETDSDDNIYIGCTFTYYPVHLQDTTLHPSGGSDFYITKYNPSGDILWLSHIRSNRSAYLEGMQVDENGNIYFSASVSSTYPGCYLHLNDTSIYDDYSFRVYGKIDTSGNTRYIRKFSFPDTPGDEAPSVVHLTKNNSFYYYEYHDNDLVYQGDTMMFDQPFLMKIDEFGEYEWVKKMPDIFHDRYSNFMTSDQDDNLYFAGFARDTTIIGYDTLIVTDPDNRLMYYKTDPIGTILEWQEAEGILFTETEMISDSRNNIYLSYNYKGTVSIGDTTLTSNYKQPVIVKIKDGDYEFISTTSGDGDCHLSFLSADKNNNLWMGGYYNGTINFGDTALIEEGEYRYGFISTINTCQREFSIGSDTTIKLSDTLVLFAEPDFQEYYWSNGSTGNHTSIIANEFEPGEYQIGITVSDGYCSYSDTLKLTIVDNSGTFESGAEAFAIIPNPAHNQIQISPLTGKKTDLIRIIGIDGRIFMQKKQPDEIINISSLQNGCYVLFIQTGEDYSYQTFIKTSMP